MKSKDYVFLFVIIAVVILSLVLPYVLGNFFLGGTSSELINQSISPNGKYTIFAYRINAGATVDYSVEAYIMENNKKKKKIYDEYHKRDAEIYWISNEIVNINGKTVNLTQVTQGT